MKREGDTETDKTRGESAIQLPPLPYPENALEPYVSERTMSFHYGRHHKGYVDRLNQLIQGTELAGKPLDEIIKSTRGKTEKTAVFNNAAQVWNHNFFWNCMKPGGGWSPGGSGLFEALANSFGNLDNFRKEFTAAATGLFGSGYACLVKDGTALRVIATGNAENPLSLGHTGLLTIDVWEHSYYLDYQNRRADFVAAFLDHLVNWSFVEENFSKAPAYIPPHAGAEKQGKLFETERP
ncbi:MAG: superoxide dismutase [Pseudomonadota bacterium]